MSEDLGGARPADNRPATAPSLANPTDIERARRRWKLHQRFTTARKVSGALDIACGIERIEPGTVEIDYHATGLDRGIGEWGLVR